MEITYIFYVWRVISGVPQTSVSSIYFKEGICCQCEFLDTQVSFNQRELLSCTVHIASNVSNEYALLRIFRGPKTLPSFWSTDWLNY